MMLTLLSVVICVILLDGVVSFMYSRIRHHSSPGYKLRSTITDDDNVGPVSIVINDQDKATLNSQRREDLKKTLYSKCAECDRGFSSIPSDRTAIDSIINELRTLSPEQNPTKNFFPDNDHNDTSSVSAPLDGAWKLIYTTAFDVLILGVNPFSITQSIYQVINSTGSAINVINVAPRLQAFLPLQLVGTGSTLRLKVYIDAKRKSDDEISLRFKSTEIKPITLLGNRINFLPSLKLLLPQRILGGDAWKSSSSSSSSNSSSDNNKKNSFGQSSGYFRVLYLDSECLIIQQNQPGGIFVSVRSSEPLESIL